MLLLSFRKLSPFFISKCKTSSNINASSNPMRVLRLFFWFFMRHISRYCKKNTFIELGTHLKYIEEEKGLICLGHKHTLPYTHTTIANNKGRVNSACANEYTKYRFNSFCRAHHHQQHTHTETRSLHEAKQTFRGLLRYCWLEWLWKMREYPLWLEKCHLQSGCMVRVVISVQIGFNMFTLAIELNQRSHCLKDNGKASFRVVRPRTMRTILCGCRKGCADIQRAAAICHPTQWTSGAGKFGEIRYTHLFLSSNQGNSEKGEARVNIVIWKGRSNRFVEFSTEPVDCWYSSYHNPSKKPVSATRISEINQIFPAPIICHKKNEKNRIGFHLYRISFNRLAGFAWIIGQINFVSVFRPANGKQIG